MLERFPEIFQLSFEEKFQLAQELWDHLFTHHEDEIPTPDWVWAELERRHAAYLANPDSGLTWEEVKASILSRHQGETEQPC